MDTTNHTDAPDQPESTLAPDGPTESAGRRWRLAIFLVLIFPVVAFAIAAGVHLKYQGELVAAVEADLGRPLTADELSIVTVETLCADPEFRGDVVCQDLAIAQATQWVAIASALAGVLLLGFIAFCTRRASRDRDALLRLFRPGLYITLVGVSLLVITDALLTLSAVYLGVGVFLGRIFPVLLAAIALGGAFAIFGMIKALIGTTRRAETFEIALRREERDEPGLHALVRDLAARLGTTMPDNVLVGLDPTFFVTEADVATTDGRWRGRSLYLSLPLMRILEPAEFRAILGHELGHFRGSDQAYSRRFYPIYRGTGEAIGRLASAGGGDGARSIALLPAMTLLILFFEGFASAERSISRDRELAADQVGVEAASARDLGSALVKVTAFAPKWESTLEGVIAAGRTRAPLTNAGDRFVELVRAAAAPAALEGLDAYEVPHPTDSHPPLSQRLDALGSSRSELADAALAVAPVASADAVVVNRAQYEETLTAWITARVAAALVAPESAPAVAG